MDADDSAVDAATSDARSSAGAAVVRVACDLYGLADPALVADGIRLALARDPDLIILAAVGREDVATAFGQQGPPARVDICNATPLIAPPEQAPRAVRGQRTASVRVAAKLVRDGEADAGVLLGPVDVALAAAQFALRPLPGAPRPMVAAQVGESVVLDVSGRPDFDQGAAVVAALLGAAAARSFGIERPDVSALAAAGSVGEGSVGQRLLAALRPYAEAGLFRLGAAVDVADFVTNLSSQAVVVTDGFSGSVLAEMLAALADSGAAAPLRRVAVPGLRGGGMVLGLEGVVVVGRVESPEAYANAIGLAAQAHRSNVLDLTTRALADLVVWRRMSAGLNPVLA